MEPLLIRYTKKLVGKTLMFSSSEVILIDLRHTIGFEIVHITSPLDKMTFANSLQYCLGVILYSTEERDKGTNQRLLSVLQNTKE